MFPHLLFRTSFDPAFKRRGRFGFVENDEWPIVRLAHIPSSAHWLCTCGAASLADEVRLAAGVGDGVCSAIGVWRRGRRWLRQIIQCFLRFSPSLRGWQVFLFQFRFNLSALVCDCRGNLRALFLGKFASGQYVSLSLRNLRQRKTRCWRADTAEGDSHSGRACRPETHSLGATALKMRSAMVVKNFESQFRNSFSRSATTYRKERRYSIAGWPH